MKTFWKLVFAIITMVAGFTFAYGGYYIADELIWEYVDSIEVIQAISLFGGMWFAGVMFQRFKAVFANWACKRFSRETDK